MLVFTSENIREIDEYAAGALAISTTELMGRAGAAVAREAEKLCNKGDRILILAGKGNNGGDGYAAAALLRDNYRVSLMDVFSSGQRSDAGKHYLDKCISLGIEFVDSACIDSQISGADLIIDGIFGIGFTGDLTPALIDLSDRINASSARVLAIDIPLGVYSDTGEISHPVRADVTVTLCNYKPCHLSYPACEYVGRVVTDGIGLDPYLGEIPTNIKYMCIDAPTARSLLPLRRETANKGSFGRALHITGSHRYRGAAHLASEGALRTGIGYLCHLGDGELNRELRLKFPEALYSDFDITPDTVSQIIAISTGYSSILIGSGCGVSEPLYMLIRSLIISEGSPLIIDADGINSLAKFGSPDDLKLRRRPVILTPHPLELSRLTGVSLEEISTARIRIAEEFARRYGVILLLKGKGTVITDGTRTYINSTGSTALAKAGSGDVLSGIISALVATDGDLLDRTALSAYLHGRAADELSVSLSEYGVIPSDLSRKVCEIIANIIGR